MYRITDYSFRQAHMLGVEIRPSTHPQKKIDVFKNGKRIARIGAIGYKDYPTYIRERGRAYADERRLQYYKRHSRDHGLPGFYALNILW